MREFTPEEVNTLVESLRGTIDRFHPRYEDPKELERLHKLKQFFEKL